MQFIAETLSESQLDAEKLQQFEQGVKVLGALNQGLSALVIGHDYWQSFMGIGVKSVWNASESLKSGALVEVLADFPLVTEAAIWLLYPSRRIIPPRVRVMIDFLIEQFQPIPPWERS